MRRAVIVDLDGTLSNPSKRSVPMPGDMPVSLAARASRPRMGGPWGAYLDACVEDEVNGPVRDTAAALALCGWGIIVATSRPEAWRDASVGWMTRKSVVYHHLVMRAPGDEREDWLVKCDMLAAIRQFGFDPVLAIDDNPLIATMWSIEGLTSLLVA